MNQRLLGKVVLITGAAHRGAGLDSAMVATGLAYDANVRVDMGIVRVTGERRVAVSGSPVTVAIVDAGKIIAIGSPRELQEKSATQSAIEMTLNRPWEDGALPDWPDAIRAGLSEDKRHNNVSSSKPARTLVEMVKWVDARGMELDDVRLNRPTLEDVFIELTGKKLRET